MSKKYLIDMHCHILPAIDDGAQSVRSSLKMLKIAADEGITHMVATPHYKKDRHSASPETVERLVEEVQDLCDENHLPIRIFPGNEVMYFGDLAETYDENRMLTMNKSEYLLIEYYPDDDFERIRRGIETVQSMGLHPILAHVERYMELRKDMDRIYELSNRGVLMQVNASSITGDQGFSTKQFVKKLLKEQIVDFVGTDAHHYESRAPRMSKCAEYLYKKYDEKYVDKILYVNSSVYFGIDLE